MWRLQESFGRSDERSVGALVGERLGYIELRVSPSTTRLRNQLRMTRSSAPVGCLCHARRAGHSPCDLAHDANAAGSSKKGDSHDELAAAHLAAGEPLTFSNTCDPHNTPLPPTPYLSLSKQHKEPPVKLTTRKTARGANTHAASRIHPMPELEEHHAACWSASVAEVPRGTQALRYKGSSGGKVRWWARTLAGYGVKIGVTQPGWFDHISEIGGWARRSRRLMRAWLVES